MAIRTVRLLAETRVEMMISNGIQPMNTGSSPRGDVSWNNRSDMNKETALCSSPCGDMNWNINTLLQFIVCFVRLLAETWVEIVDSRSTSVGCVFVSLRRRELKFHYYGSVLLHSGSSPCGDVSCNTESAFKEHLKEGVRSLAEMWVEIVYLAFMRSLPGVLRLRKETWIEIPVPNKMLAKKSVRLRKETWIEILQLYILMEKPMWSSRRLRKPPPTRSRGFFHLIFCKNVSRTDCTCCRVIPTRAHPAVSNPAERCDAICWSKRHSYCRIRET